MRKEAQTSESSFSNPDSKKNNIRLAGSRNEVFPAQPLTTSSNTDEESMSAAEVPSTTSLSATASSVASSVSVMASPSTSAFSAQLSTNVKVDVPGFLLVGNTPHREERLKQWIWKHRQDVLFNALEVKFSPDLPTANNIRIEEQQGDQEQVSEEEDEEIADQETKLDEAVSRKRRRVGASASSSSIINSTPLSETALGSLKEVRRQDREHLLDTIARVQRQFFQSESPRIVFGGLLDGLLDLMDSEYGFIGEVKFEDDGTMYLQTHAVTNIAWDQATREFYDENVNMGLKFCNLKTLFGTVMTTRKPVISNDPKTDSRAGGLPEGHPPLNHFLGLPFFRNGELLGMVGISNKPGGYKDADVDFLEPLTMTCSNLIQAYQQMHQNEYLINTLEESVKARTSELEHVNRNLEEANRQVRQNAMMQMQHFACMSHEIRTPLNCIIGMSSLLNETNLDPMQKESMDMIIASGDLLLAIVNDVLDYAKLETDHVTLNITRGDLQEMLQSILYSIEMKAQTAGQTVKAVYDPYLPTCIHTDMRKIQQILFNLLGNALKFSKDKGVVEFSAHYVEVSEEDNISKTSCPLDRSSRSDLLDVSNRSCTRAIPEQAEMECDETDTPRPFSQPATANAQHPSAVDESDTLRPTCPFARLQQTAQANPVREDIKTMSMKEALLKDAGSEDAMVAGEELQKRRAGNVSEVDNRKPKADARLSEKPDRVKSNLIFEVKDYGKGIPRDSFDAIFRPFEQTPGTEIDTVYGGTGLGLTITKKLVSALGGTIAVDSELGSWSKFTVTIPCTDPPAPVEEFAGKVGDAVVLLVGLPEEQKDNVMRVFGTFDMDVRLLNDLAEIHDFASPSSPSAISLDKRIMCLIEGKYVTQDWLSATAEWPTKWNRAMSFVTFGSHMKTSLAAYTRSHIRSLEQTFPISLIKKLDEGTDWTRPPRLDDSSSASETTNLPESEYNRSFENLRILIAEDNKVNQKVLLSMLKRLNLTSVDIVQNGRDAVEQESQTAYDVVLMDQQMPVMGGIPACRAIRSRSTQGSHPIPQIVFVTAHVSNDVENECHAAGCSGFLSKPFKVHEIESCLRRVSKTLTN